MLIPELRMEDGGWGLHIRTRHKGYNDLSVEHQCVFNVIGKGVADDERTMAHGTICKAVSSTLE